jgi:uncharacterized protein (TIGR02145 family)
MKLHHYLLYFLVSFAFNVKSQTITIGSQIWADKNLNVKTFRNGDIILEAKTIEDWVIANENKQPAWCYFQNDSLNCEKFGLLYNWYAVNDVRGLAPEGFHVPSDEEWEILKTFLGGESIAGLKIKAKDAWIDRIYNDKYKFSAFPGGYRNIYGDFKYKDITGIWWSSTKYNSTAAFSQELEGGRDQLIRKYNWKSEGLSVRCLKNMN